MDYATILYEADEHVATITINRPDALNSFNQQMCDEFEDVWKRIREDDDIHVVVVRAAGDRAFCTGIDVKEGLRHPDDVFSETRPRDAARAEAEQGVEAGGRGRPRDGCGRGDVLDQRVRHRDLFGGRDVLRPARHLRHDVGAGADRLARRVPLGEVLRWALLGLDERMSAERALQSAW